MVMITPFMNITLLIWKQFIVFEFLMTLPLFRMRRILLMWRVVNFLVDHEKNALGAGYIVEFIHYATENYYEGGTYACRNCNNIMFPLYVLKVLKLCLFYLPMLVDYCSHKLFAHKIPMHRKWVRLKCASHILYDACWKYALGAIIKWLLLYFFVHGNCLLFML